MFYDKTLKKINSLAVESLFQSARLNETLIITGPPTHSVGASIVLTLWRLSSSFVVVCNTPRWACRPLNTQTRRWRHAASSL